MAYADERRMTNDERRMTNGASGDARRNLDPPLATQRIPLSDNVVWYNAHLQIVRAYAEEVSWHTVISR
jgi:hypothetical protein